MTFFEVVFGALPLLAQPGVPLAEVQLALCGPTAEAAASAMGLHPTKGSAATVYLLETAGRDLRRLGFAARELERGGAVEHKVKRNYPSERDVDWAEVGRHEASCEWDVHAGLEKVGCKSSRLSWLDEALPGAAPRRLGPLRQRKLKTREGPEFDELTDPAGRVWLEVSVRVRANDRQAALRRLVEAAERGGVAVCADQQGRGDRLVDELF